MKKYALAIAIACGALSGLSAQAAPVLPAMSGVQNQVTGDAVKVWHCRYWSGIAAGTTATGTTGTGIATAGIATIITGSAAIRRPESAPSRGRFAERPATRA